MFEKLGSGLNKSVLQWFEKFSLLPTVDKLEAFNEFIVKWKNNNLLNYSLSYDCYNLNHIFSLWTKVV